MPNSKARGLPPRIYVPIVALFAVLFLVVVGYFVAVGFGVAGSVFGRGGAPQAAAAGAATSVEGGPPPAVVAQLQTLRKRIAEHPNDDVAITQLGDMELAANRFAQAIPLYERALRVNPHNVAAQTGLAQARAGLKAEGQ